MRLDKLHIKLMETMNEAEKQSFKAGLKALNMDSPTDREALRESIKRLRPDFSEAMVEIFVNPEASPKNTDWIV